jgi:adenylyltransferase/sulfurtransferase
MSSLTDSQQSRYSRNVLLAELGQEGQRRLLASHACVVGAGGLGSPALSYLVAAGVGRVTLIEGDRVELSNLQRQTLYGTTDLGRVKADAARERLRDLNPDCRIDVVPERLAAGNITGVIPDAGVVLDCTDNFPTRFLLADHCWRRGLTLVSAAAIRFQGLLMVLRPGDGRPCYRCFMPGPPAPGEVDTADRVGVFGTAPGVMGAQQAVEAVKLLLGIATPLLDHVLVYDGLTCTFRLARRTRDPQCSFCAGGAQ